MEISEDRLRDMENTQRTILEVVTELKLAVCGSEKIGVDGLISKVKEHSKYIESDRKLKYTISGAAAVIASLFTYIWQKFF